MRGRSNTIRRELIEETRDGVSLSMLNDPKRSPSQYHFIAGPTDSDDELAWCMTPAFGGLYFALAMCDQDIVLARPILINKKNMFVLMDDIKTGEEMHGNRM